MKAGRKTGAAYLIVSVSLACLSLTGCFIDIDDPFINPGPYGFRVLTTDKLMYGNLITIREFPHPFVHVNGFWASDITPVASGWRKDFQVLTDRTGFAWVDNGRVNAYWNSQVFWPTLECPEGVKAQFNIPVAPGGGISWECRIPVQISSTKYETNTALPASITLGTTGAAANYATPQLYIYGRDAKILTQMTASQVASDGSTVTFPFPRKSDGSSLNPDIYGMQVVSQETPDTTDCYPEYDEYGDYIGDYCYTTPGQWNAVGANFVAIGGNDQTHNTPFGVDTYFNRGEWESCYTTYVYGDYYYYDRECTGDSWDNHSPIITSYAQGQVSWDGWTLAVGTHPVVVKTYAVQTSSSYSGDYWSSYSSSTTQPTRALVVNNGSNSVSVVDLQNTQVISTIQVGSQPTALAINPAETFAYVANYNSGTVSEINLGTLQQSRSVYVGYYPTSVSLDANGGIWVGGQGYVSRIEPSSFSVAGTYSVNGMITSLAVSQQQSELIYTLLSNNSGGGSQAARENASTSNFSVRETRIGDFATLGAYNSASGASYDASSMGGSTPISSQLGTATLVSANYGNALAISATPTGFVLTDLSAHVEIMRGTTPSSVRSIAVDPDQSVAYLACPATNTLITVPLPPLN